MFKIGDIVRNITPFIDDIGEVESVEMNDVGEFYISYRSFNDDKVRVVLSSNLEYAYRQNNKVKL